MMDNFLLNEEDLKTSKKAEQAFFEVLEKEFPLHTVDRRSFLKGYQAAQVDNKQLKELIVDLKKRYQTLVDRFKDVYRESGCNEDN